MSSPLNGIEPSPLPSPRWSGLPPGWRPWSSGTVIGALLVVATLLNGTPAFLKRVGAIEADRYDAYWRAYCDPDSVSSRAFGLGRSCALIPRPQTADRRRVLSRLFAYVFAVEGIEVWAKALKDVGMIAIVGVGLWLWRSGAQRLSSGWPVALLSTVVVVAVPWTLRTQGDSAAMAGLRCFLFLGVALVAEYATRAGRLDEIASAVALLLVLQLLLIPWELLSSMPFMGLGSSPFYLPRRLAAGFVVPSTLGIFAAAALSFCVGSSVYKRHAVALWATAVLLVVLAASGTGVISLIALLAVRLVRTRIGPHPAVVSLLVGLGALMMLPSLLGRSDLFNSVIGPGSRLETLGRVASRPALTLLFGEGLGSGTNTLGTVTRHLGADSTLILLILQIGVLGAACFYALLVWAGRRDPRLLPFYVTASVCSLTLNLPEVFPLNLLLGLALAHSASSQRQAID